MTTSPSFSMDKSQTLTSTSSQPVHEVLKWVVILVSPRLQDQIEKLSHLQCLLQVLLHLVRISYLASAEKIISDISTGRLCLFFIQKYFLFITSWNKCISTPLNWQIYVAMDKGWYIWSRKCKKTKISHYTHALVGAFPMSDKRFTHNHISITTPLLTCEGQSYWLTCINRFFQ